MVKRDDDHAPVISSMDDDAPSPERDHAPVVSSWDDEPCVDWGDDGLKLFKDE